MKNLLSLLLICLGLVFFSNCTDQKERPNILLIIADDWSYPHASFYGDEVVKTPHFDRVATEGLVFDHAYVSSPSCTPSRAALLTGQHFWRLQEGGNLYGPLRPEFTTYTDILDAADYHVGFTDKGWGPGESKERPHNPAGKHYSSFNQFLEAQPEDEPFCFWLGSLNPHRGYKKGSGLEAGLDTSKMIMPACFPESDRIRSDIADYYKEVQDFDNEIGAALKQLEANGQLDNTLIIVTSDNGMPFPRCKSNLYDMGTRVPLAIRWGNQIKTPNRIADLVSLTDLAPTILNAAQEPVPNQMTGKTLSYYFNPDATTPDQNRAAVFFGKERHVPGQELGDWGGYPMRAIRTQDYLYIKNFQPDAWPAGTPFYKDATLYPAYYADVDGGPTRTYMINYKGENEEHHNLFNLAFAKRPKEELYDLNIDPDQLVNVAEEEDFTKVKKELEGKLMEELKKTKDPRAVGGEMIFSSYPYTGGTPLPDDFNWQTPRYATQRVENFPSKYISGRTVEILTPINIGYDERFPVLYMFDGQNIFHEFTDWEGKPNKGWQVDQVLDSLYLAHAVPQVIVVGIFNGKENRTSEYMPAKPRAELQKRIAATEDDWYKQFKTVPPASDAQLKFIVEELKPFIDSTFNAKTDRADTFIAGSSMGGLISAYAICEYPKVFGGAACLSTHWPILDGVFLEYLKNNLPDPSTHKIYFDFGTEGLDAEYEPFQNIADQAMQARGYEKGKNWLTKKFEGAKHHEEDWHQRFPIPMEFLMGEE